MTSENTDFLLLGGGPASVQAAETLRQEGSTGAILILSAEPALPCRRPFLSKDYRLGKADDTRILIHPASFYREQQIDVVLDTRAETVDTAARSVRTSAGSTTTTG